MKQFQIVQKFVDSFVIRYVADRPITLDAQSQIQKELSNLMGYGLSIGFERVTEIARTPAGKFMLTTSEIPGD